MNSNWIFAYGAAVLSIAFANHGFLGKATIDLRRRGQFRFEDFTVHEFGFFRMFSFKQIDESEVTRRAFPQFMIENHWGVTLRPVEIIEV